MSPEPAPNADFRRSEPATGMAVRRLRTAVERHLQAAGVDGPLGEGIKLATSEAIGNAVLHAYPGASKHGETPGPVHVVVSVTPEEVRVVVTDEGAGMAPRLDSPGAGLGLLIIMNLADGVEVARGPGARGTEVRMRFAR